MIWRLFFIITVLLKIISINNTKNIHFTEVSNLLYFLSVLQNVIIAFILGTFFSLGWKQRLFSKKSINIFLIIFIIYMPLLLMISSFQAYPDLCSVARNNTVALICTVFAVLFVTILLNLFFIPIYIGFHKYNKNFDSLTPVGKPYWKLFALYSIPIYACFFLLCLTKYSHFALYNFIDFGNIIFEIYGIILLIGFAWNIRIFNKLFWQITAIPYVLLILITPFFASDTFKQDWGCENYFSNPVAMVFYIVLSAVFIYIIYRYAYKEN